MLKNALRSQFEHYTQATLQLHERHAELQKSRTSVSVLQQELHTSRAEVVYMRQQLDAVNKEMSAQKATSAATVAHLQAQVAQLQEALRLLGHAAQASAVNTCSLAQQEPAAGADISTSVSAQVLQLDVSTHSTLDSTGRAQHKQRAQVYAADQSCSALQKQHTQLRAATKSNTTQHELHEQLHAATQSCSAQHKQHTGGPAAKQSSNIQHKQHTLLQASDQSCSTQQKQQPQLHAASKHSAQVEQHSSTQRTQDTQLLADSMCWVSKQPIMTSCSAQHMQLHARTKPLTGHHTGGMQFGLDAASKHQQGTSTAVYSKAQAAAGGQDPCPANCAPKLPPGTAGQQQLRMIAGAGATVRCPAVDLLRIFKVGPTNPVNVSCILAHSPAHTSSQPEPANLDVSQLCSAALKQISKLWGSADVSTIWAGAGAGSKSSTSGSCADESELASHAFWEVVTDLF
jgi:hypothetical protein